MRKWVKTPKAKTGELQLKYRIQGQLVSDVDKALVNVDHNIVKRINNKTLEYTESDNKETAKNIKK